MADIVATADGRAVTPANPLPVGPGVFDVTLQNGVSATGGGTTYSPTTGNATLTFEVRGTSTSRTVLFEIAGPGGVYVAHTTYKVTDSAAATQTTGGTDAAPEFWQVDVPAGWSFHANLSAVAGGNVSIAGKAVVR